MHSHFRLSALSLSDQYRTGENNPALEFFLPCLRNAVEYKRAVGYFRSSVYLIIGPAAVEFALRGGKIRLVCSPCIERDDLSSISEGYKNREKLLETTLSEEIEALLTETSTTYRTKVLATLVAMGALEIRLALRPQASGLYHEKLGIFQDEIGNSVSFLGSANETWNGWHFLGNHEAIEVFRSWAGPDDAQRVARHDSYFERLWEGMVVGVETVPFPDAAKRKLISHAHSSAHDIDLGALEEPVLAQKGRKPLPHQASALDAWRRAGRRGVLEHATGSGKTYTAITAIKEHLDSGNPGLIVVPSRLLLKHWAEELENEIPELVLLIAGSGHLKWKQPGRLRAMTDSRNLGTKRLVLATMQTAATSDFFEKVRGGNHLMIVADEVHQSGSSHCSQIYNIQSGARLGLSATPTRFGDPEGTFRMFDYFGAVVQPVFTLNDAIKSGRLVEYEYHPHPINLTEGESEEWKRLTLQIIRELGGKTDEGPRPLTEKAKMLLIRRSRIAKKAFNKIPLAADVLAKNYQEKQRWLVYCEDSDQLGKTMEALRKRGLNPVEYHTNMQGDMDATLDWFKSFGGILVSIKCLDEGVDIPSVDHALILASSQNPRQFIQRRGRVLRTAKNKTMAVIHDALVVPQNLQEEPDQIALLKSELARAIEFADSALNKAGAAEIRSLAASLGFDRTLLKHEGIEEENEE